MALIVVVVIMVMSLVLAAELGPKADPTTTTYVPRPEWYFFFLFELLRVIKPPELVPIATIGIPTICMVLLLLLPFYDRSPERRPSAARWRRRRPSCDHLNGLPHLPRRPRRLADRDRLDRGGAEYEDGARVAARSGCLACHQSARRQSVGRARADRDQRQAVP